MKNQLGMAINKQKTEKEKQKKWSDSRLFEL
jgi:hypothetical protein